jgi:chromosome partitioning protein
VLVVSAVSQKGGGSKTTTTIHLAVAAQLAGLETVILDTDPQGTAEAWGEWRKEAPPVVIAAKANNLQKILDRAAESGAQIAFIDTPPLAQAEAASAARVSDLVLIPCRPRAFDLHAIRITADLVRTVGKKGFVVFSGAHTSATDNFYAEPEEIVRALGLEMSPIRLAERADYHRSVMTGQAAQEIDPNSRASMEVSALWAWVCKQIGVQSQKPIAQKPKNMSAEA